MTKHRIRRSLLLLEVEPSFASNLPSKFSSVVLIPRGSLEIFGAPSARSQVPFLRESIFLLTVLPEANLNGTEAVVLSSCAEFPRDLRSTVCKEQSAVFARTKFPSSLPKLSKRSLSLSPSYQKSCKRLLNPAPNLEKLQTTNFHRMK